MNLSTADDLRAIYRMPGAGAAGKSRTSIDEASARFIAKSPIVMLATASAAGHCDVSPRGGPPGFVTVLDDNHIAIPDLGGNNRLDSLQNVVDNPQVGLLFLVPGLDDTLRINGPATISTADDILDRHHPELRRPKSALVVETRELFVHCAKAFRRSRTWQPETWAELADAPDLVEIVACQFAIDDREALRDDLEQDYVAELSAERAES
ncbi:MAG TPA: MSMEG_1061 family FMN-dependent PPOX-type flavoprotein [Ilumatobacteraceae bacterium]|nr:MSMEG_1061 family FMN-dependent PPOX-type flavoprotein [Ilumatobacteraceae bacterium]